MIDFVTSNSKSEVSKPPQKKIVEKYFILENYVTSEGAVSHNGLYYISSAPHYSFTKYGFMLITILSNITNSAHCF